MDLLFPLLIIFMIGMIFFSNRQRKKQQQQQENLQNSIAVGDVVLMTSGISGTVVDVDDERTIDLEIAPDVITTWLRAAVREKLSTDGEESVLAEDTDEDAAVEASPTVQAPVVAGEPQDAHANGNGVSAGSKESRNN